MPLKTPDTTTAQLIAYLTALVASAVILFKLDLSDAQIAAAIAGIGAIVPLGHMIADAIIRRGRASAAAAQAAALVLEEPEVPN